jgi:Domain of unknown function (DUF3943)
MLYSHKKRFKSVWIVLFLPYLVFGVWARAGQDEKNHSPRSLSKNINWIETQNSSEESIGTPVQKKKPVLEWGQERAKSYFIPAMEVPAFILALNGFSRLAFPNEMQDGKRVYDTNLETFWDHLVHGPWVLDHDPFQVNQIGHPYQGGMYFGFARSTGLNYWESSGYAFAGSFLWETGGETTKPSINDQIASGIAGAFLGEPLFRMAGLLLEGQRRPGFWRELGAAAISPPTGLNRLVFGDRFASVFPSHQPAVFWQAGFEATLARNTSNISGSGEEYQNQFTADFSILYGLPGKPGYSYNRPFDYFRFDLTLANDTSDPIAVISAHGLLVGKDYERGENFRGIWGLYGSYDYISRRVFRVSTTAASLGTTFQWWLSPSTALQATALGGIGYGAGANISNQDLKDYHYGLDGQGLLSLGLILGDRLKFDAQGRSYLISGWGSNDPRGYDDIYLLSLGATLRLFGRHALALRISDSERFGHSPDSLRNQKVETVTLLYTLLGDKGFGTVDWRRPRTP